MIYIDGFMHGCSISSMLAHEYGVQFNKIKIWLNIGSYGDQGYKMVLYLNALH